MRFACASSDRARRSSIGASGRANSTVPEMRTPCSIGVRPNMWSRLLILMRGRTPGIGQHHVVAALGFERNAVAERARELARVDAGGEHERCRRRGPSRTFAAARRTRCRRRRSNRATLRRSTVPPASTNSSTSVCTSRSGLTVWPLSGKNRPRVKPGARLGSSSRIAFASSARVTTPCCSRKAARERLGRRCARSIARRRSGRCVSIRPCACGPSSCVVAMRGSAHAARAAPAADACTRSMRPARIQRTSHGVAAGRRRQRTTSGPADRRTSAARASACPGSDAGTQKSGTDRAAVAVRAPHARARPRRRA